MHHGLTSAFAENDARRPSQAYSNLTEYNARRPSQDPMYLQNSLCGAVDPRFQQPSTAYDRQSDHMDYGDSTIYRPRAIFEATPSKYHDFEPRKVLQVSTYNPERGTKGSRVYVYLESSSDFVTHTPPTACLMFASRSVPAVWTRLDADEQHACYKYMVCATAPAFSQTGSSTLRIPLRLQLQDQSRPDASPIDIGDWLYEDGKQLANGSSPREASRKRKVADEPSDTRSGAPARGAGGNLALHDYQMQLWLLEQRKKQRLLTPRQEQDTIGSGRPEVGLPGSPAKRILPSEQQTTQSQGYGSYTCPTVSSAYPQSFDFSAMQRKYTVRGRSLLRLQNLANTMGSQGLIGGTSTAHSATRQSTDPTSSWDSSYVVGFQSGSIPHTNMAPPFQPSPTSSPSPANPRLERTSKIQLPTPVQLPTPSPTSAGSPSDGRYNSHGLYPNPAVLEIRGNLNAMQANWTPEECTVKRRIVRFWREQNWATIIVYFQPLRADERSLPYQKNERRISCLYWEEETDYYITSVDTISLLELLLDKAAFETEEKNRIRRNLENKNPKPVSSNKLGCESFFDLIMGFPDPKPSKIKKSVKVFKWSVLEQALNKIVSKYVCSNSFGGRYSLTLLTCPSLEIHPPSPVPSNENRIPTLAEPSQKQVPRPHTTQHPARVPSHHLLHHMVYPATTNNHRYPPCRKHHQLPAPTPSRN